MRALTIFCLALGLLSCSSVQKMAVSTTASILKVGGLEMEQERDWDIFKDSITAGVKTMEAMSFVHQENEDLLLSLTKGYTGLGYGVYETLSLEETLADADETPNKNLAEISYSRAIHYGLRYLEQQGLSFEQLNASVSNGGEVAVAALLDKELSAKDQDQLEGVLFTAQAWGALINLKKSVVLMGHAPIVKGMFDWACNHQPDIAGGVCPIVLAAYDLGRPQALGGQPEKGRKTLEDLVSKDPENLFARVAYLQFWVIPSGDEDTYKIHKSFLEEKTIELQAKKVWIPGQDYPVKNNQSLYRAIALKRFELITKFEKKLF